jgi:hypothetical protein
VGEEAVGEMLACHPGSRSEVDFGMPRARSRPGNVNLHEFAFRGPLLLRFT